MKEHVELNIRINQDVDVEVHIGDIIRALNELPIAARWNHVAQILNHIDANETELDPSHKKVILDWLHKKVKSFNEL